METIGMTDPLLKEVFDLGQKALTAHPFEILLMEWGMDRGKRILRVYINCSDQKVGVQDCAQVSQILEMVLEAKNMIPFEYTLEVSSPGLNRPLSKKKDFEESKGKLVKVECVEPISGRKKFHGFLTEIGDLEVQMAIDGENFRIPFSVIKKARLDYFGNQDQGQKLSKEKGNN